MILIKHIIPSKTHDFVKIHILDKTRDLNEKLHVLVKNIVVLSKSMTLSKLIF